MAPTVMVLSDLGDNRERNSRLCSLPATGISTVAKGERPLPLIEIKGRSPTPPWRGFYFGRSEGRRLRWESSSKIFLCFKFMLSRFGWADLVIIERITNRQDVEILIDPTMMLQKEEWDRIVKKPKEMLPDKYIVCYFL